MLGVAPGGAQEGHAAGQRLEHADRGDAGQRLQFRIAGVDEHHRLPAFQRVPDRREPFVPEIGAVVVAEHQHAVGAELVERASDLVQRAGHVGQRQGGEIAEPVGTLLEQAQAVVVDLACQLDLRAAAPAGHRRGRQGDHGGPGAEAVHDADRGVQRPVRGAPHRLAALGRQRIRPERRDHVGVHVDAVARHGVCPLLVEVRRPGRPLRRKDRAGRRPAGTGRRAAAAAAASAARPGGTR